MKNMSIARRYARAIFQLASENKSVDDVRRGFTNLAHAISDTAGLEKFLNNPIVKPDEKQELVSKITSNKLILKTVYLLAKRKRLHLLPLIDAEIRRLSDEAAGLKRILIRTPSVLS